jgi:hypothetical protein
VRYETVEKTPQGLQGRLIEREGPTGLIVTTTREGLHPENETRLISLTLADGQEQTKAILAALADEDRRDEVDREPWMALQRWIASSDSRVVIPFAPTLVSLVPPIAVRLRRDTKLLLNLIRAHALLHQAARQRDQEGRVVAALDDYAAVYELVAEHIAEGVQASVPATVRQTVAEVGRAAAQAGSATVQQIAAALEDGRRVTCWPIPCPTSEPCFLLLRRLNRLFWVLPDRTVARLQLKRRGIPPLPPPKPTCRSPIRSGGGLCCESNRPPSGSRRARRTGRGAWHQLDRGWARRRLAGRAHRSPDGPQG